MPPRSKVTAEKVEVEGVEGMASEGMEGIGREAASEAKEFTPPFSPEAILSADILNKGMGAHMQAMNDAAMRRHDAALDRRSRETAEQKKSEERNVSRGRAETLPLRKSLADKSKYAREGIRNKDAMLRLLKKGDINDPLTVQIASYLPGAIGNKLLSSDTLLYTSGLFDEFGILRTMFPGATRTKEIDLLEGKLATLDKSHEAKAKILENGMLKLDRDIILSNVASQLEKERPGIGVLEFEEEIFRKAQPELDALFNRIIDNYDKIYTEFAPSVSSYIDQDGNEYRNVPKSKLKKLFQESKEQGLELKVIE